MVEAANDDAEKAEGQAEDEAVHKAVHVKKSQIAKAVKALKDWISKKSANQNALFDSATESMQVLFTLSRYPDKPMKSVLIPLPHPLYDEKSEICFICKDPQRDFKELLLRKHKIPGLTKVIGVGKLRRNYLTIQQKKDLADSFDLFIVDKLIAHQMPNALGRTFYKDKLKAPLPVRLLDREDPTVLVRKAINSSVLRIPQGVVVGVKFGRCSWPEEELVANALAVIRMGARELSERFENPVMTIYIQATDSPSLPVWMRPKPPGPLADLRKYRSDSTSSASDTGVSGASETEATGASDTASLETFSNPQTPSEAETPLDTLSEPATSEIDSEEVGDEELPVVKAPKKGKRKAAGGCAKEPPTSKASAQEKAAPASAQESAASPAEVAMGPPAAKKKKAKKG